MTPTITLTKTELLERFSCFLSEDNLATFKEPLSDFSDDTEFSVSVTKEQDENLCFSYKIEIEQIAPKPESLFKTLGRCFKPEIMN